MLSCVRRLLTLSRNSRVEVEGTDPDASIVVQLANHGAYEPAFRNKVMADMFKLIWVRDSVPSGRRAILVVTDVTVRALGGWVAVAAADPGIDIFVFATHALRHIATALASVDGIEDADVDTGGRAELGAKGVRLRAVSHGGAQRY